MSDTDDTPESSSDRARLVGINHVALEVGDIDDALEFYGSLFEFDLRSRSETTAFLDMGDQFVALAQTDAAGEKTDDARHFGLVVDDADRVAERLESLDIDRLDVPGLEFHDPWGNRFQIVDYEEIQFTKADHVLEGMGLAGLEKTDDALRELDEKGLAPDSE
ncbi:Glyoxalase/bleomycin resistance protein/dioxygenase [Haloterrigena turkmenica DSM 5511]|uniref:Glyoxalase/bleomycin resistance protein/dioxygenase n=1 Tax=Haloterrigena turkmenica (strain ATCC 51198 / DSM 5511 / JCM 9101 / NCIMB 13204 / VKM B-1734 / 4k) TaxID=543526 RepID=D2RVJ1_HALTV|nr:VOC family protein [Haloterrigena turkmenica]ADB59355.1 Glyoxalase/bleomycin resistance protein/dioxygenase [Haloterrigena turkmenica DSM 5511]